MCSSFASTILDLLCKKILSCSFEWSNLFSLLGYINNDHIYFFFRTTIYYKHTIYICFQRDSNPRSQRGRHTVLTTHTVRPKAPLVIRIIPSTEFLKGNLISLTKQVNRQTTLEKLHLFGACRIAKDLWIFVLKWWCLGNRDQDNLNAILTYSD